MSSAHPATVATVAPGTRAVLLHVDLPPAHRLRLAELGLRRGATLQVRGRTVGRGRVVAVGTTRLALDRRTAARLSIAAAPA